jgi:hypothetical protein
LRQRAFAQPAHHLLSALRRTIVTPHHFADGEDQCPLLDHCSSSSESQLPVALEDELGETFRVNKLGVLPLQVSI